MITIQIIIPITGQEYMVADSIGDETRKEEKEAGFNSEELVDLSM